MKNGRILDLRRSFTGVALLAFVLLIPFIWVKMTGSNAAESTTIAFYASVLFVVGLQVFSGNSGIISFGHLAFAGIGAYSASLVTLSPNLKESLDLSLPVFLMDAEMGFGVALVVAAVVSGLVAILTSGLVLRLTGTAAVIAIFALLLVSNVVFAGWNDVTHGAGGLYGIPKFATLEAGLACAIGAIVIARLYKDSGAGLLLRSSREDELAAASIGVPVRRHRAVAWVMSAMICGVGGALLSHHLTAFSPATFYLAPTFAIVVMLVVGGMGTVGGALLGAVMVTGVQEALRGIEGSSISLGPLTIDRLTGLTQLALVVMILAVLYTSKEGLLPRLEPDELLRRRLRRRRAPDHDISEDNPG